MEYDTVSCGGTNTNEVLNPQMSSQNNELAVPDSKNSLTRWLSPFGFLYHAAVKSSDVPLKCYNI